MPAASTIMRPTPGGYHGRARARIFTIGVNEDDLRVIAEHGYEGAASADHDHQAQAVTLSSPTCSPPRSARVTALQQRALKRRCNGRKAHPPVGCDPAFSRVADPARAHIFGRCIS